MSRRRKREPQFRVLRFACVRRIPAIRRFNRRPALRQIPAVSTVPATARRTYAPVEIDARARGARLDLMMQRDLASAFGGGENGDANFKRCEPPFAGMQRRLSQDSRVVEFIDDLGSRNFWRRKLLDITGVVAIDNHGLWHWPKIGPFATHDHQAEMVMGRVAFDTKSVATGETIGA